jgi:hypothetical protein
MPSAFLVPLSSAGIVAVWVRMRSIGVGPKGRGIMRKLGLMLIAAAILLLGSLARNEAVAFAPAGIGPAVERMDPVERAAACRERRWGWHGWGWYPCGNEPVNTCEKCRWRWGYKYCWHVC